MSTKAKYSANAGRAGVLRPVARRDARVGEAAILRVLSEHGLVSVDQVGRILKVGKARARRRVAGLVALGWVETRSYRGFVGEWVTLTRAGAKRDPGGLCHLVVGVRQLSHRNAITEARLALRGEHPDGVWICERELWSRKGEFGVVPDGVLEVAGRRIAVEVEMSRKTVCELRAKVMAVSEAFDEVIYFAAPYARGQLRALCADLGVGNVEVRDIPGTRELLGDTRRTRRSFEPTTAELRALRLITEEGLVAVDQLGMLLGLNRGLGIVLAHRLEERNFVVREFEVDGDGGWLRCRGRAADLSGTGLGEFVPTGAVSLDCRETLARVRVDWCARPGRRRWVTRRRLVAGCKGPRRSDLPIAVAGHAGREVAVVLVDRGVPVERRQRDLSLFARKYDGVLCVAEEETIPWLRRYVEAAGLENVEVEEMP
jgi:hypothetical protein